MDYLYFMTSLPGFTFGEAPTQSHPCCHSPIIGLFVAICGCVISIDPKNQGSHYESRGWYHYTCLHSNCPLNIVLVVQQHVFIISQHSNGSSIIPACLMWVVRCLGLTDKSWATNGLLISLQVTQQMDGSKKKKKDSEGLLSVSITFPILPYYGENLQHSKLPHKPHLKIKELLVILSRFLFWFFKLIPICFLFF